MKNEQQPLGLILVIAAFAGFFSTFINSAVVVALPAIGAEFQATTIQLNWIVSAFVLASAAILIPSGRAADIFGRKRLFLVGLGMNALLCVAAAFAPSFIVLVMCRVLQGFASALLATTSTAILISVFPPDRRGQAIGINVAAIYVGLSSGPVLGGLMIHALGWRSMFWLTAFGCAILVFTTIVVLKSEWREAHGEKLDLRGSILYAVSLVVLMIGVSYLRQWQGWLASGLGLTGLFWFVWLENRSTSPMFDVRLFRTNRIFAMSNLAAMISYSATFAVSIFLSLYLQKVRGLSAWNTGMILLVQPLIQAILSPITGKLSDSVEPRLLSSAGMALAVAGLLVLATVSADGDLVWCVVALALIGIGFALFSSPNTNAVMGSVEKRQLGVASAILSTMRTIGQVASMAIALLLNSIFLGQASLNHDNQAAYLVAMHIGFTVFATLCFLGIFASMARGKMIRPKA